MMAFALGFCLGLGLAVGFEMGFEMGFETGLFASGCGRDGGCCWGRLGAEVEVDADVAVDDVDTDRARAGREKFGRDGGGERRFCGG